MCVVGACLMKFYTLVFACVIGACFILFYALVAVDIMYQCACVRTIALNGNY